MLSFIGLSLTSYSKYFPPVTTSEKADEPAMTSTDEAELAAKLPDPPTAEPKNPEEPASKKQKTDEVDGDGDFVIVDKADADSPKPPVQSGN